MASKEHVDALKKLRRDLVEARRMYALEGVISAHKAVAIHEQIETVDRAIKDEHDLFRNAQFAEDVAADAKR